jgi:ABC-type dipeptide/oligopeptide/nickel transport system permease subunit
VVFLLVAISLGAPLFAPNDPNFPDFFKTTHAPDWPSVFGTDHLGRDQLSRIIYGGRLSLFVAVVSILLGIGLGSAWGMASGYLGGKFDLISQRLLEILMAMPGLILAMMLAFILSANMWTIIVAIAFTRIAYGARVIRSVALSVRETAYVEAARSIGAPPWRVMLFHVAPQTFAPFLVLFTTNIGIAILIEASLGFIGLGIAPPTATWGGMLGDAAVNLEPFWWMVFFPGLFITIAVLAFNLAGDGLRDMLDPRSRGTLG